ncbi:hypothetical protein Goari_022659 [Gossypium aridum]|uniref:Pectinesterase inhibitor domain-containing protein n=1 Tax=Gossypium aridum TaxID=34290 RepID=A0A7J8YM48_GOSAI|nr:hypothetical protein [Gossypium aridum]
MAIPNQLCLVLVIFLSIFVLSSLPTNAILPKVNVPLPNANIPLPVVLPKLVENLCNIKSIGNHRFCLKALSTPEVIVVKDFTQLGTLIMKLGAENAKVTLNVYNEIIMKPSSPQALKALNCCIEAYQYAVSSFEMVYSELIEDLQTANNDVTVAGPKITNCEKELIDAKVQASQLLAGNRFVQYYIAIRSEITSTLELENQNEY